MSGTPEKREKEEFILCNWNSWRAPSVMVVVITCIFRLYLPWCPLACLEFQLTALNCYSHKRTLLLNNLYSLIEFLTHLHLVTSSKNEWNISPLPQYAFIAWCSVKAQRQLYL